ncbi:MAG: hypothetical protein ACOYM2_05805 [Rectinemataceae bacterium]
MPTALAEAGRNRGRRGGSLMALVSAWAFVALSGCSSGPPELLRVDWILETRPEGPQSHESLSVFADVRDPDGIEDLEAIWIINDQAEILWSLDSSTWASRSVGGDTWLGSADLTMADRGPIPRGQWRLVVADLAGNRVSQDFLVAPDLAGKAAPRALFEGGKLRLAARWPENFLLAYDGAGALIRTVVIPAGTVELERLVGTADYPRIQALAVYGFDSPANRGGFSPRIKVK